MVGETLAGQGFGFGFEDGEDFYEVSEFEDLAGAALQAVEGEAEFQFAGKFEAFDEGGNAGAVDVFDIGEIHDDARMLLFFHKSDERGAQFGRVVERDIAGDIDDHRVAGLAIGNIHEAWFICTGQTAGGAGRR